MSQNSLYAKINQIYFNLIHNFFHSSYLQQYNNRKNYLYQLKSNVILLVYRHLNKKTRVQIPQHTIIAHRFKQKYKH